MSVYIRANRIFYITEWNPSLSLPLTCTLLYLRSIVAGTITSHYRSSLCNGLRQVMTSPLIWSPPLLQPANHLMIEARCTVRVVVTPRLHVVVSDNLICRSVPFSSHTDLLHSTCSSTLSFLRNQISYQFPFHSHVSVSLSLIVE